MKKLLLTVVIATMIATLSFSQENYTAIKAGINLASVSVSASGTSASFDRVAKPSIGIAFNQMISDNIAIQPEIAYHGAGYKFDNFNITWHYLAIPVLLKYYASETFALSFGPQLGVLVGGNKINDIDTSEGLKSTDLALNIGLEAFLSDQIGISGRYVAGVSNLDDTNSGVDIKNNAIQLSLVFKIN